MEINPEIIKVKQLLQTDNLKIPDYQRPYKWTEKNVNQLIDDIIFHKEKSAYRLGTLVIHKDEKEVLNIVDGQQRTVTLILIACAIVQNQGNILEKIFKRNENKENYTPKLTSLSFTNEITKSNIQSNYKAIERRISEFDDTTINFFYEKCEIVKVILNDVSEAFQFFDSQNARGKDLEPHDLLKAFHLREMNNFSTESQRKQIVEQWEAIDTTRLSKLFSQYLFRIKNWCRGYSARYFTKNEVDIFKGVSPNIKEDFPFAKLCKIADYYTENYNDSYHRSIDGNITNYPFQLDQTLINGRRFFESISYYDKMIEDVKNRKSDVMKLIKTYRGNNRTGDKYVRNLFYCGLIYYVDKFGENELDKAIEKIFIWTYTLRLKLYSVGLDSVDNYALNKAHSKIQLFKILREAIHPSELLNEKLDILKEENCKRTIDKIVEQFERQGYYERNT